MRTETSTSGSRALTPFYREWPPGRRYRVTKHTLLHLVGYHCYDEAVLRYHNSEARTRIITAPNRSSKSYAPSHDHLFDIFPEMLETEEGRTFPVKGTRGWIVGPTYAVVKEFDYLYDILVRNRSKYGFSYSFGRQPTHNPEQGSMHIDIQWGKDPSGEMIRSIIEGKSATNDRSLQAEEVDWCILSEAADQSERILSQYLGPRVKKLSIPTTPKIHADWVRKLIDLGHSDPTLGIEHFVFPPDANPEYDWERYRVEAKKAESRQGEGPRYRWGCENCRAPEGEDHSEDCEGGACVRPLGTSVAERDPYFSETFRGAWSYETERAIPFRWQTIGELVSHVIREMPLWCEYAPIYVSMDYGYTDPAVALWWALDTDGTSVLLDEIYETRLDPAAFVRKIHERSKARGYLPRWYIGDPKKPEVASLLRQRGLPVFDRKKNLIADRAAGMFRVIDALSDDPHVGRPKLYVMSRCPKTIEEWKLLRRKEIRAGEFSPTSLVGADHAFDAARYYLMAQPKADQPRGVREEIEEHRRFVLSLRGQEPGPELSGFTPTLVRAM